MGPRDASDPRGRQRETRFRRAQLLLFVVVAVCLLQISWWIFFQVRQSGREHDMMVQVERADPARADQRRDSRVRMAVGEGAFLAAALIGGVCSIYWLMQRELKREYEQNQLLAAVSHDFRSPLTAIRLIAQSFELGRVKEGDRARMARTLASNVRRLEDLVENVLAAAQLHAGRLHAALEPLDLGQELERCLEQRRALLDERGATLDRHIEAGVTVRADRSLLQGALGNLLDNAVKYSPKSPHLTLTVARDGERARFTVKDQGLGFDPAVAGRLFDRFQRGDAEQDRSRPGLGLGLYLTRALVRLHGGEVRAHSPGPGQGAEFSIFLPMLRGQTQVRPVGESGSDPVRAGATT